MSPEGYILIYLQENPFRLQRSDHPLTYVENEAQRPYSKSAQLANHRGRSEAGVF